MQTKSLLILRYAKSSCKDPDLTDHDRPLNKRGKGDAPRMGGLLRREHLVPDTIISSSAVRARATAEAVAKASGYKGEIISNSSLYGAEPQAYIDVLHEISDDHARALIIGHNPGLEELVRGCLYRIYTTLSYNSAEVNKKENYNNNNDVERRAASIDATP